MGNDSTRSKIRSRYSVIKTALYYFAFNRPDKIFLITFILCAIVTKNLISGISESMLKTLEKDKDHYSLVILKVLLLNFSVLGINFLCDALFQNAIVPYGSKISQIVLRNALYSNNNELYTLSGSHTDYYVVEGGKELAKLNKSIILGLWSKITHCIIDFYLVFSLDNQNQGKIFAFVIAGVILITVFKGWMSNKVSKSLQINNHFVYKREKQYSEIMDSVYIVKSYRYEDKSVDKYKKSSKLWEYSWINYKYMVYLYSYLHNTMGDAIRIGATIYYVYSSPTYENAKMLFLLKTIARVVKSSTNIVNIYKSIIESIVLTDLVLNYLEMAREDLNKKVRIDTFNDKIEVKGLTYSARGKTIFSDVEMVLHKGDKVALHGRNGVGKSSIFKVLMNFDDYQGDVFMDGIELRRLAMQDYRAMVTYVPQDTRLFDESIYSNLIFGNDKPFSEVVAQCKRMEIHDKIMSLPGGYNTVVGEFGKNINGGLRQKIFYARAFLRDTPIYLFDEPTNNLDERGSRFILEYINDEAYAQKTFLVICHDMDIVYKFPKRYLFDESKLILEKDS